AGLPLEQVDQLGFASSDAKVPLSALIMRKGKLLTVELRKPEPPKPSAHAAQDAPIDRVRFGEGDVLVVAVRDVRDDLGDELAQTISEHRDKGERKLSGIVLDLRGNG